MRNAYKHSVGDPEGKRPSRYLGGGGARNFLKWIIKM
jgi:hypothetical protein